MPDYEQLALYLGACAEPQVTLTLTEIEAIIGELLPWAARWHRGWWATNALARRVHDAPWRRAGWRVERASLTNGSITFSRLGGAIEA